LKICIGLPSYRPVDPVVDLARMRLGHLLAIEGIEWGAIAVSQQPFLTNALDSIAHQFLKSKADRLLILDDDVAFNERDALKLIRSDRHAVGGDYPLKCVGSRMICVPTPGGREDGSLIECVSLGLGFSAWDRSVIEDVAAMSPAFSVQAGTLDEGELCRSPFATMFVDGRRIDGDMAFFRRVLECGHTMWCDRSIALGHVGVHIYTSEDMHHG